MRVGCQLGCHVAVGILKTIQLVEGRGVKVPCERLYTNSLYSLSETSDLM